MQSIHGLASKSVETFAELDEALAAGSDRIMLDEFSLRRHATRRRACRRAHAPRGFGGVDLRRCAQLRRLESTTSSIGALTKHVRAIDLSMRIHTGA